MLCVTQLCMLISGDHADQFETDCETTVQALLDAYAIHYIFIDHQQQSTEEKPEAERFVELKALVRRSRAFQRAIKVMEDVSAEDPDKQRPVPLPFVVAFLSYVVRKLCWDVCLTLGCLIYAVRCSYVLRPMKISSASV